MDLWIALPLLLTAVGAILTLLIGSVTRDDSAGILIGVAVALGVACWLLQTPPAVVAPTLGLSADLLPRLFGVFFSLLAAGVLCLSYGYNRDRGICGEEYPATVLFILFGMLALSASTNLMTLFLGLEAMSFGFYILVAIDLKRQTSGETGLKYLLPGALSSAFLAFGIALLYAVTGTLSVPDVVHMSLMSNGGADAIALAGWGCLLIGVAFKLSLVPAHFWTPDVYQGAAAPVVAFLSGGSKGAAVLLVLLLLPQATDVSALRVPLWSLAFLSLLVGNLAGLLQTRVRRLLAYSSIAQMGYIVIALLSGKAGGYQAAAFYTLSYGAFSLAAFGAVAVLERGGCGETLDDYRGLGSRQPFAAGVLALTLFALAGIPPTAGFTGKFLIFTAAIRSGEIALAIIGILLAAISVYYYLKIVGALYFKHPEISAKNQLEGTPDALEYALLSIAAIAILLFGLWPTPFLVLLSQALP